MNPIAYHTQFHPGREFADRTAVDPPRRRDVPRAGLRLRRATTGSRPSTADAWDLLKVTMDDVRDVYLQLDNELADTLAA